VFEDDPQPPRTARVKNTRLRQRTIFEQRRDGPNRYRGIQHS
jgi:hypothetical protein